MDLQYLVREPETITSDSRILFLLHGFGSNEEDLFSFVPTLPEDWIVVSFRAPRKSDYEGYAWYDIDFMNEEKFVDVPQAVDSLNEILKSIQQVKARYGLNDSKVHLGGFSQGGVLSYALALTYPELFDKVACMSAYPEKKLLVNMVQDNKKLHHLRFFISHGTEDAVVPLDWGRKAAELLYDLSCFFTFREYMNGHGVNQKNYIDLMEFYKN